MRDDEQSERARPELDLRFEPLDDMMDARSMVDASNLLGFDVIDTSGYSAILNCGLDPSEQQEARAKWSSRLTKHHLFHALDDAQSFRTESDQRITKHAPFFVARIHARAVT